jgi:hypothetical protein
MQCIRAQKPTTTCTLHCFGHPIPPVKRSRADRYDKKKKLEKLVEENSKTVK